MASIVLSDEYFKIGNLKDSISQSIKSILMTSPGERLGDAFFGCRLKEFLFELDFNIDELIQDEIARAILTYEPRVIIEDILLSRKKEEPNKLYIDIKVRIIATFEELVVNLPIEGQE